MWSRNRFQASPEIDRAGPPPRISQAAPVAAEEAPAPVAAAEEASSPESAREEDAEEEALAEPQAFAAPPSVPAALRPLAFDPEAHDGDEGDAAEDEEADLALTLPLSRQARAFDRPAPGPEAAAPVAGDDPLDGEEGEGEAGFAGIDAIAAEDGCGSLLDIRRGPREREFVRIEDAEDNDLPEPVVVFPGQEDRRATPAADGPAREAGAPPAPPQRRPFDAPAGDAEGAGTARREPLDRLLDGPAVREVAALRDEILHRRGGQQHGQRKTRCRGFASARAVCLFAVRRAGRWSSPS